MAPRGVQGRTRALLSHRQVIRPRSASQACSGPAPPSLTTIQGQLGSRITPFVHGCGWGYRCRPLGPFERPWQHVRRRRLQRRGLPVVRSRGRRLRFSAVGSRVICVIHGESPPEYSPTPTDAFAIVLLLLTAILVSMLWLWSASLLTNVVVVVVAEASPAVNLLTSYGELVLGDCSQPARVGYLLCSMSCSAPRAAPSSDE